ncbi:hypothetical protein J437_LFUL010655 [Ladona fulva]|uniref:Uncharacterized protein n=1 Tax=Ladona fulva TaxID=123851 RepID=A0A8K0KT25_LADFU|nr:hypothetical protein J437_LFUL010655 [Ladona fulva]
MEEKPLENGRVAYLSDILDQLNKLNLKLQDNIQAFILKLQNWLLKVNLGNLAMFEHLSTETEESETGIVDNLREEINNHLRNLDSEIQPASDLLQAVRELFLWQRRIIWISIVVLKDRLKELVVHEKR